MKTGRRTATGLSIMLAALCLGSIDAPAKGEQPAPAARGKGYNKRELGPGGPCKNIRLAWSTTCRQPAGRGLALDGLDQGVNQLNELPRPHTRILEDGTWKNIYPELREKNPLQSYCDKANELKVALRRARARTRHIWFKGLEPEAERARLDKEAVPAFHEFLSSFEALIVDLRSTPHLHAEDASQIPSRPGNLPDLSRVVSDGRADSPAYAGGAKYELGQVSFAMGHFNAARELLKTAEGMTTDVLSSDHINAMQGAQVHIEIGADALDAEPTPRVLSTPAYDKKTGLYVLFGGDHFDYLMNDTWVFDPAKRQWFQRHPEQAPEPRGKHAIIAPGDGTIQVSRGYMYKGGGYVHVGADVWTYDIEKNTWSTGSGMKSFPPDTRAYRGGVYHPSYFLAGPKPNAAEHEKKLASLPVNEWVPMNPQRKRAGGRDWGTKALDVDRDMIIDWNGGHSAFCSTTAPHYHLGVNRWELPYPEELPLGMIGASGDAVIGFSFNHQRWITNHTWSQYDYDRRLKKLVIIASMRKGYFYTYDPLPAEWAAYRQPVRHCGMAVWTPRGTLHLAFRPGPSYELLDYETMTLKPFKTKGELTPRAASDAFGMTFDTKRDRLVGIPSPGNGLYRRGPSSKVVKFIDMKTNRVKTLTPENAEALGAGCKYVRELRYIPDEDIVLICSGIMEKYRGRKGPEWDPGRRMVAWDPGANRWLVLNIKNRPIGHRGRSMYGWSFGCRYDEKRKLLWGLDNYGYVCAMRLDVEKAVGDPTSE